MAPRSSLSRLLFARLVSRIGGEAAFIVGIWGKVAFEFEASPGELAVTMGAFGVSSLFGFAAAGMLIDRFDPRRVLLASEIVFVPVTLGMIFTTNVAQLALLAIAFGFVGAPIMTAVSSMPPYLTTDHAALQRMNSAIETAGLVAFVAGPAVGATVVRFWSVDWVFVLDAATSLLAAAAIAGMSLRRMDVERERTPLDELTAGILHSYRDPRLRFYMVASASLWLAFGSFIVLEPIFFRDVVGVDIETLGWVTAVFGLGSVAGSVIMGRFPVGFVTATALSALLVCNGLAVLLYVGTADLRVVVIGALVWGVILGMTLPLLRSLVHANSPDGLVGRITGALNLHNQAGELVPLAIAPALAAVLPVQTVLIAGGMALACFGLLRVSRARALDRARAAPQSPSGPTESRDGQTISTPGA